jgi:CxxC motif-containing protein (DUF1111 family)
MPRVRLHLPSFRLHRSPFARQPRGAARNVEAPPGGRLFGLVLVGTGVLLLAVASAPVLVGAQSAPAFGPDPGVHDPGPRGGPSGAGAVIGGATADETAVFTAAKNTFKELDSVSGAVVDGSNGAGLGPRFNNDSCSGCHAQPDVGGSSPPLNPQIASAHRGGASNPENLSAFIQPNGPVREVRFVKNADGSNDGGVHDLFTISGRVDAPGCNIAQPNFGAQLAANNAIFRIPTPVFGAGLIEAIPDQTILNNQAANAGQKSDMGISGRVNREGNAGTITRFGWKAQNKSLAIFGGEAYLVEQGVSNELFPDEREQAAGCQFNSTPEDHSNFTLNGGTLTSTPSDVTNFSLFMRFLAPPAPQQASGDLAETIQNGQHQFGEVGCALCHTPSLQTGNASNVDPNVLSSTALTAKSANLFSDLLVHNMGTGLADGVSQGGAGGQDFRSAPLWGVGQRLFFLHDGRTNNLLTAIEAHASTGSEANKVISNFNRLDERDQQAILVFLRSL